MADRIITDDPRTTGAAAIAAATKAAAVVNVHKMTILFFGLFSVNALCTSITGALAGAKWVTLDGQTRFLIVIAIIANWTGFLIAFFRTALVNLTKGKPIISGDTTAPIQP